MTKVNLKFELAKTKYGKQKLTCNVFDMKKTEGGLINAADQNELWRCEQYRSKTKCPCNVLFYNDRVVKINNDHKHDLHKQLLS